MTRVSLACVGSFQRESTTRRMGTKSGVFLDHLKSSDGRIIFHQVRKEFAGDQPAIGGAQDVELPADDFLQQRQASATGAGFKSGDGAIAGHVTDERHAVVVKIGDDDIAFLAGGAGLPFSSRISTSRCSAVRCRP